MNKSQTSFENLNKNISQQKVNSIYFNNLKNLRDFEIYFYNKHLTAIMGPNGCGKSTIIHALACCYQPLSTSKSENNKFGRFFPPTTHSIWNGSDFTLTHSFRVKQEEYKKIKTRYHKATRRWWPIYTRRPARYVSFIGIETCVPQIEKENQESLISYSTKPLHDDCSKKTKEQASIILNRNYNQYNRHVFKKKEYIGVGYQTIEYSSLSMGAGEQRLFIILQEIIKAPNYALILIDELDLLLHDDALKKLLKFLIDTARQKNLQIIFTTHSQGIIEISEELDDLEIKHICQTETKTLGFSGTKSDAIYRLTGKQERPLEIFVEDDLAKTIVKTISAQLGMSKYVSIKEYGAAINCFTVLAGLLLNQDKNLNKKNMLFVLDGDVYRTQEEKQERLKKFLIGDDPKIQNMREEAVNYIVQFTLEENCKPEKFLHEIILSLSVQFNQEDQEDQEIIKAAKDIIVRDNSHKYIDDLIERMDYIKAVGLQKIIDLVSQSDQWEVFIQEIKKWLESKKENILEN